MSPRTHKTPPTLFLARQVALAAAILLGAATPAFAIAGKGAKLEFAIDAPWRIEPTKDAVGNVTYGSIPVQISIHDALLSSLDEGIRFPQWISDHHVGRFVDLIITQINTNPGYRATTFPPQRFTLLDLDLIERTTGLWQIDPNNPCLDAPRTEVCQVWRDPSCAAAAQWIEGTSEWHAVLHFTPQGTVIPGTTVRLSATVRLSRERAALAPALNGLLGREVTLHDIKQEPDFTEDPAGLLNLVNEVAIYLGDEPLPRFGADWLYGDLHYHSQGTDNEGESAYNYRGVLDAMGAMGIDFVFATEHASDSTQIVDGDTSVGIPPVSEDSCGLRDMSPERFAALHGSLHGTAQNPDGANRTVMSRPDGRLPQTYLSHGGVPQVFLGGEVDVIPEIGVAELIVPRNVEVNTLNGEVMATGHALAFGDGLRYEFTNLCGGAVTALPSGWCYRDRVLDRFEDTYLLKDLQGFNDWYHARQHIIYLPGRQNDPNLFVSSRTEKYGGGGRLLFRSYNDRGGVVPEIEAKGGSFFLAHPLASAGKGSEGPDLVPYSEYQLRALLQSPAFLGLQFWNEDTRLYSEAMDGPPPMEDRDYVLGKTDVITEPDGKDGFAWDDGLFTLSTNDAGLWNPQWSESRGTQFAGKLYHGAYTWDRMLLWGLGAKLWFTRGCEPRKVFMAGGSDAHGDFNYRREGAFHGTDGIVDTAIAKPRNLVRVGPANGKPIKSQTQKDPNAGAAGGVIDGPGEVIGATTYVPHSQEQIVEALRSGEFCVTDGPALRVSIGDTPMGGVHYLEGTRFSIRVDWKSTPEFGPLDEIHLYVGAGSSQSCAWEDRYCPEPGIVYTPSNAGPRNSGDELYATPGPYSSGPPFTIYRTNERLRINEASEGSALGFEGSAHVLLGNGDLRLANSELADRYFVRAVGRTSTGGCGDRASLLSERCQPRFAYTNPVWVVPGSLASPPRVLFQRGDANGDGEIDLSDALTTLNRLFLGGAALDCEKAADSDANESIEITDAVRTLGHLFLGSAPPPAPYPGCGPDPRVIRGGLTCQSAPECGTGGEPSPAPACMPDLTITAIEKQGALEIGQRAGFTQRVRVTGVNQGGKISGPNRLTFSHGTGDLNVGPIDPGVSWGILAEVRFGDSNLGKVIQLSAHIDGEAAVEESREDNNGSAKVTIDFPDHCELDDTDPRNPDRECWDDPPPPPPGKPDIVAVGLAVTSKIAPPAGETYGVRMQVTLKNQGTEPAGAFQVALRFETDLPIKNPTLGTPWTIPALAAGATQSFAATVSFPVAEYQGETHSFYAAADPPATGAPSGSVIEGDETNNSSPPITISFP